MQRVSLFISILLASGGAMLSSKHASRAITTASTAEHQYREPQASESTGAVLVELIKAGHIDKTRDALKMRTWLRTQTSGNYLNFDGSSNDSPEHRKLWLEHAHKIAECLGRAGWSDPDIAAAYVEALMYQTSSQGIARSMVNGQALKWLNSVNKLKKMHPEHDGGVAFIFWGSYHLCAPWPLYSVTKARTAYGRALSICETSCINNYWCGVAALLDEDKGSAARYFEKVLHGEFATSTEKDMRTLLLQQARLGLDSCQQQESRTSKALR